MEPPPDGEGASLATSVLPQLVGGLRAPGAADRAEALGQLAQIVDTSFGEDALARAREESDAQFSALADLRERSAR